MECCWDLKFKAGKIWDSGRGGWGGGKGPLIQVSSYFGVRDLIFIVLYRNILHLYFVKLEVIHLELKVNLG